MAKKFPKTLFVKIEKPGDDGAYFVASEGMYELCEMGDRIQIATYQLVEVTDAEVVLSTKPPRRASR